MVEQVSVNHGHQNDGKDGTILRLYIANQLSGACSHGSNTLSTPSSTQDEGISTLLIHCQVKISGVFSRVDSAFFHFGLETLEYTQRNTAFSKERNFFTPSELNNFKFSWYNVENCCSVYSERKVSFHWKIKYLGIKASPILSILSLPVSEVWFICTNALQGRLHAR